MFLLSLACQGAPTVPSQVPWSPVSGPQTTAVLATVSFDYTVGTLATIDLDTWKVDDELATVSGDPFVAVDDGMLLQINRFGTDTVRVYSPGIWQAPVIEMGMSNGAPTNPRDAALCAEELFVLLYEESAIAVLDPMTGAEREAVDLSAYADKDGIPEAWNLVEKEGRLFVALNRLDRAETPWADRGGQVIELDCASHQVTRSWDVGGNAMVHDWMGEDRILVSSRAHGEHAGGLQILDPVADTLETVISLEVLGGSADNAVAFGDKAIVAALDEEDYDSTAVHCIDLVDGTSEVLWTTEQFVTAVEGNDRGEAWVGLHWGWNPTDVAPGVEVVDIERCAVLTSDPLRTVLAPYSIAFY